MLCKHCEAYEATQSYGLCAKCYKKPQIRLLYKQDAQRPAERQARIELYTERAKKLLPLFQEDQS